MKVCICPDKFKGSLTATEAATHIANAWAEIRPQDQLTIIPVTDGGDGFGALLGESLGMRLQVTPTCDSSGQPIVGSWWRSEDGMGVFETATVIGLAALEPGKYHPFDLDTRGLGAVFQAMKSSATRHVVVGIGGSSTNDGGFGLARALGWTFEGKDGAAIERWTDLADLERIIPPDPAVAIQFDKVTIAADVSNPLLGPEGATRVYGPQKGIQDDDFETAEENLSRLSEVVDAYFGKPYSTNPGAGAAGGLGFALSAFLNGEFQSGFDLYAAKVGLGPAIDSADLVITGEGAIDSSTAMGKGVGAAWDLAQKAGARAILLGGQAKRNVLPAEISRNVWTLVEECGESNAFGDPQKALETVTHKVARNVSQSEAPKGATPERR